MEQRSVEAIVKRLNEAGVRYLIVGGLAVVAHGFVRFTADIDMVLDPDPLSTRRAIQELAALGYRPRAPVEFEEYAEPATRARWVREKGLTVFSVFSPDHAATEIDLFVELPFDFERAYAKGERLELAPKLLATFVSRADLIDMKRKAGRPRDLRDVESLQSLERESGGKA